MPEPDAEPQAPERSPGTRRTGRRVRKTEATGCARRAEAPTDRATAITGPPRPARLCSRSARSASCTATSVPARSTPCANRSRVGSHELAVIEPNILGVLSLTFWSLTIVITIKYLTFVMRADNQGEGGILTLTSMVVPKGAAARGSTRRAGAHRLVRHRAALRRRHHHARHLGALGRRGNRDRDVEARRSGSSRSRSRS